jgi:type IV pilus assembly protein PilX
MLSRSSTHAFGYRRQAGVVLMMALIMLVAMTLAGVSLVRSVDTSNLIAGNLAFKQSTLNAADYGAEDAFAWLTTNNAGNTLQAAVNGSDFYFPARGTDPAVGTSWDDYWEGVKANARSLGAGDSGNTVSYVIHRLCNAAGAPTAVGSGCAVAQGGGTGAGSSKGAGFQQLTVNTQAYYRVTTRVVGPRNTVSYTQTVIRM